MLTVLITAVFAADAPVGVRGSRWRSVGPAVAMQSVTIHPTESRKIVAGGASGAVWASTDGGVSWRLVLPTASSEREQRERASAEGAIEQALGDVDLEAIGDVDAFDAGATEELADAAAQIQQVLDGLAEQEASVGPGAKQAPWCRVRFVGDILWAARADGLFRSEDVGARWTPVLDLPTFDVVQTEFGWVAGTQDGARVSGDGEVWMDPVDGSEGITLTDLLGFADGRLLGVGPLGLFASDGFVWETRSTNEGRAPFVHGGPFGDAPVLLLGTERALRASYDGGLQFVEVSPLLVGVNRVVRVSPGHWLLSSADGVWQTVDWGSSFQPLSRGLPGPSVADLAVSLGTVIAATPQGLMELRAPVSTSSRERMGSALRTSTHAFLPVGDLVDSAVRRTGVLPGRRSSLGRWLPMLNVNGRYTVRDGVAYNSGLDLDDPVLDDDAGTLRRYRRDWRVGLELRWSPSGRRAAAFGSAAGDLASAEVGLDSVLSEGSAISAGRAYERELVSWVSDLVTQRSAALERRTELDGAPLLQQVLVELRVREIEGELDALTDGGVSEWRVASRDPEEAR